MLFLISAWYGVEQEHGQHIRGNELRIHGEERIFVFGPVYSIATEMGVESSARHALNLGFLPVIAKEAVSSGDRDAHLRSLANMGKLMPVLSNEEILSVWS